METFAGTDSSANLFRTGLEIWKDVEVTETQIRCWIMPLDADASRVEAASSSGILVQRSVVDELGHLDAVDPGRQMIPVSDYRHREPFVIFRDDFPSWHAAIEPASAIIDCFRLDNKSLSWLAGFGIVLLELVRFCRSRSRLISNLGFVAGPILTGDCAKKDSAVEMHSVADALELKNEVFIFPDRLDIPTAILDVQPPFLGHGVPRFTSRVDFPSLQILTVEDGFSVDRFELQIADFQRLASESFQSDGQRRIRHGQHFRVSISFFLVPHGDFESHYVGFFLGRVFTLDVRLYPSFLGSIGFANEGREDGASFGIPDVETSARVIVVPLDGQVELVKLGVVHGNGRNGLRIGFLPTLFGLGVFFITSENENTLFDFDVSFGGPTVGRFAVEKEKPSVGSFFLGKLVVLGTRQGWEGRQREGTYQQRHRTSHGVSTPVKRNECDFVLVTAIGVS